MAEKLTRTMHVFGIVFLIMAIIMAVIAVISAMADEKDTAELAKYFFKSGLFFTMILWITSWLIS